MNKEFLACQSQNMVNLTRNHWVTENENELFSILNQHVMCVVYSPDRHVNDFLTKHFTNGKVILAINVG